jgi:RNA polymerase sigma-70 factor (ECF subfamily)
VAAAVSQWVWLGNAQERGSSADTQGEPDEVNQGSVEPGADLAGQISALHPRLLRFAQSLTHDREAAADLAQETMVRALAAQWRFRPGTNLKAWLFRILRNIHLNAVRTTRTHPGLISIEELGADSTRSHEHTLNPVEAEIIERSNMKRIVEVYRTLPPAFGIPLHLTAVEELSYAEVAAILDIPVGTVMSRVYRGRRLLISRLAGGS